MFHLQLEHKIIVTGVTLSQETIDEMRKWLPTQDEEEDELKELPEFGEENNTTGVVVEAEASEESLLEEHVTNPSDNKKTCVSADTQVQESKEATGKRQRFKSTRLTDYVLDY